MISLKTISIFIVILSLTVSGCISGGSDTPTSARTDHTAFTTEELTVNTNVVYYTVGTAGSMVKTPLSDPALVQHAMSQSYSRQHSIKLTGSTVDAVHSDFMSKNENNMYGDIIHSAISESREFRWGDGTYYDGKDFYVCIVYTTEKDGEYKYLFG